MTQSITERDLGSRASEPSAAVVMKRQRLLELLRSYESCAVAYSGGVDSAVVAKAAYLVLGQRALAVTGVSASLAEHELDLAKEVAAHIGIRHHVVHTDELSNQNYVANAPDRCYHCKTELYEQLRSVARHFGLKAIVNGANADDLGDFRPGMRAAKESAAKSPLAECGFTKADVRELASAWGLPVATKPATPCLSSRIAYGQAVTPERLRMIDRAEQLLRRLGIETVRVRYHEGDIARIEVPLEHVATLCDPEKRAHIVREIEQLGFKFITLDLAGFRSGGFAKLISPDELQRFS